MCPQSKSRFVKGIVISTWTIVQTIFHILLIFGGYYVCKFKPSHYILVIFYVTYFYEFDKCGSSESIFSKESDRNHSRLINLESSVHEEEDDVYNIIYTITEKGIFPKQSNEYARVCLYMFIYIIKDGCLLISAFLLFAGICFQVKKCLAIIFYGPWILTCAFTILLDVVAAVHFGLDLLHIYNYTSWLRFIGISNYKAFSKFNKYESSTYVPLISSIVLVLFWSRFCVFWILNIVNFFHITSSFSIAYQVNISSEENHEDGRRSKRQTQQTNSAESRIRNWQVFYGTVETNSTRSSFSNQSADRDYNSNNSRSKNQKRKTSEEIVRKVAGNSTTRYSLDSNLEFLSSGDSSPKPGSNYMKYQDVTDGVNMNQLCRRESANDFEFRQRPWSYLRYNERPPSILLDHGESSHGRATHLDHARVGSTLL